MRIGVMGRLDVMAGFMPAAEGRRSASRQAAGQAGAQGGERSA